MPERQHWLDQHGPTEWPYGLTNEGAPTMKKYHLAAMAPADRDSAHALFVEQGEDGDGVSEPRWIRLANGDLILGVFPHGDTYHAYASEADEAIESHDWNITLAEDDLHEAQPTKREQMENAANVVLAQPGTVTDTDRTDAAIRLAELTLGLTDKETNQ